MFGGAVSPPPPILYTQESVYSVPSSFYDLFFPRSKTTCLNALTRSGVCCFWDQASMETTICTSIDPSIVFAMVSFGAGSPQGCSLFQLSLGRGPGDTKIGCQTIAAPTHSNSTIYTWHASLWWWRREPDWNSRLDTKRRRQTEGDTDMAPMHLVLKDIRQYCLYVKKTCMWAGCNILPFSIWLWIATCV